MHLLCSDLRKGRPLGRRCDRSVYGVRKKDGPPRPELPCPEPSSGSVRVLLFVRLDSGAVLLRAIMLGTNLF